MAKWLVLLLLSAVVLLLLASSIDAQRRNRNRNRNRSNNRTGSSRRRNNSNSNRGRSRGNGRRRPPHASCEEINLPMCKGLVSYTHTKLPNKYNHTTQEEVYRVLEHKWAHMDHSCSSNTRLMLCTLYLPKCHGAGSGVSTCKRTCMTARRRCNEPLKIALGIDWDETYPCDGLPRRQCIRPQREKTCPHEYPTCVENNVFPICQNLTFSHGTLPNMFNQCDIQEINKEVEFYTRLRETQCHTHLDFLLCGVYSPFCVRAEQPFAFPCRELCEEIRTACAPSYESIYDLPWPNKMQCHRYPSTETQDYYTCVMPGEGTGFTNSRTVR